MNAFVDGGGTNVHFKPVVQKLPDACARTAQAQVQGANQAHQSGADQVPLGQLDTPALFFRATPRLGTRPMTAAASAVHVSVQNVGEFQAGGSGGRRDDIDLVAPVVSPRRGVRRYRLPAHGTLVRTVSALPGHGQFNGSAIPGRSFTLPRFAGVPFRGLGPFPLRVLFVFVAGRRIVGLRSFFLVLPGLFRLSQADDLLLWGPVSSIEDSGRVEGIYAPDACSP